MPVCSFVGFGCCTTKQIKYKYYHALIALLEAGQLLSGEYILQTCYIKVKGHQISNTVYIFSYKNTLLCFRRPLLNPWSCMDYFYAG